MKGNSAFLVCNSLFLSILVIVNGQYVPPMSCKSFADPTAPDALGCPNNILEVSIHVGSALNALAYEKGWFGLTEESVYPDGVATKAPTVLVPKLGECMYDCDRDDDCAPGLLCADAHKDRLASLGYDRRKANCPKSSGAWNEEVCFRKDILPKRMLRSIETEEHQRNQNERELCTSKCICYCNQQPGHPVCLFLGCKGCRRRKNRDLQLAAPVNVTQLELLATAKLRELAGWKNITDTKCKTFLQTAQCTADPL